MRANEAAPRRGPRAADGAAFNADRNVLERALELGTRLEANALARLDLDLFAGAWVAAHARGAVAHGEGAEAGNAELHALLQFLGDRARDRLDGLAGVGSLHARFLQGVDENLFAHVLNPFFHYAASPFGRGACAKSFEACGGSLIERRQALHRFLP